LFFDAANQIGKFLRGDFDSHFAADINARKRIDGQTLFGQANDFSPRRLDKICIVGNIAFGIIEKDEINLKVGLSANLREKVFDKLRLTASGFARHGEIAVCAAIKFYANCIVSLRFPINLQIESLLL
jgi:hypothetical protein